MCESEHPPNPTTDAYPSSEGQRQLGRMLCDELAAMSVADAKQDENALVWGTVPASDGGGSPTVALVAHSTRHPRRPVIRSGRK